MANVQDLLGALLRRGMTDSSTQRIENSLSDEQISGQGGVLERELGVSPARETTATKSAGRQQPASPTDAFSNIGNIAKSMMGGGEKGKSLAAGGLGALLGAILGGGGKSAKGAIGGGALALLGSIALKALRGVTGQNALVSTEPADSATRLAAGLRAPENAHEEQHVQSIVDLTVKAMVNAAKADGRIDEDEMQKVVGELQEDGVTEEEREFLLAEVRKPMDTEAIVRACPNRQVAAQIYAASLLAIEVDTPAEKAYLEQLARDLDLDSDVVDQLHSTLGVA